MTFYRQFTDEENVQRKLDQQRAYRKRKREAAAAVPQRRERTPVAGQAMTREEYYRQEHKQQMTLHRPTWSALQ